MDDFRPTPPPAGGFHDAPGAQDDADHLTTPPPPPLMRRRGAGAVAAAIAVMLTGAGALAIAMNGANTNGAQAPEPGAVAGPVAASSTETRAQAAMAPPRAETTPRAETAARTASREEPAAAPATDRTADRAEVPAEDAVRATRGVAPALNPLVAAQTVEFDLLPQVKPAREIAVAPAGPARAIALGQPFLADAEDGPAPFFFASDITAGRAPRPPLSVAYAGDVADGPETVRVSLNRGENFVDALSRAGVRAADRNAAAYAFGQHQNLRALRPDMEFVLTVAEPNRTLFQEAVEGPRENHLLALDFRADAENRISLKRGLDGGFYGEKNIVALTTRLVAFRGRIDGSLYLSAKRAGAPDEVIAALADMFSYDVDFQREIFGGDEFEAIYEARYDDQGEMVGAGDIVYGRLKWRGQTKEKGYYLFASHAGSRRGDYFDRAGQSAKRLLMKTPIDGARLSSGFGTRRHPILGYARAHKGIDFAAPRGTPIKAAGDGIVERADRYGSFGNYIRLRHANGYKTAYAHLNGFARTTRAGRRVVQGDVIGYVGTTGRSTGPHLHYEVHLNGQAVNPQTLKIAATGVELKGAELDAFKAVRDRIDAMRLPPEEPSRLLAREDGTGRSAL